MAKRKVTPVRRKPLRAAAKGPPPRARPPERPRLPDHFTEPLPCCGALENARVMTHEYKPGGMAYCRGCGAVLTYDDELKLRFAAATTDDYRRIRPEMSRLLDTCARYRIQPETVIYIRRD